MNPHHKYKTVNTFVFDVDGVLTNGNLLATDHNGLVREMNTRDGYALKMALSAGYNVCIITGGASQGVELRLSKIGIKDIYLGIMNKLPVLEKYMAAKNLQSENIMFMGDDLPDLECMLAIKYRSCPKDASHDIKKICDYISPIEGGRGCVRDVIEKIMRVQGKW